MSNIQTAIIRLAFRKGSDEIHVGLTKQGNKTFIGEIVYSQDLVVSHYNQLVSISGQSVEGNVGTICIADDEEADLLIEQIESIQANRPLNERGNKYPFVFLRVVTDGLVIYNKGNREEKDRLTFLDVELIEVEEDAPPEVAQIKRRTILPQTAVARYGTVSYQAVRHSRKNNNQERVWSNPRRFPSVVEPIEIPLDSQQDKLNMVASAMRSAGMSPLEIAEALKEQVGV
ncbi:hypothetical protein I4641_12555 [Waterburya agarophytonicola K14]|uniref:Uncharacterized protein n=1 Tax=Waterburya agarophytonicola KI4 TaxID=2874699 RepID=A0A964FHP7_9CYAN|nr:hypothetical protein [Waterburya agarophytonicola]MCC0177809.1 hypothetical protein [Waterburya agarophytonicola KI4]